MENNTKESNDQDEIEKMDMMTVMISVCDFKNVLLEYINYSYEETVWLLYLLFFCGGCEENENACDLLRRGEERGESIIISIVVSQNFRPPPSA